MLKDCLMKMVNLELKGQALMMRQSVSTEMRFLCSNECSLRILRLFGSRVYFWQ